VFLYEDSSNKTSEDNDEYELFAEVFKRVTTRLQEQEKTER
jgi:hypothetical protein